MAKCIHCGNKAARSGSEYCSSACEIEALKAGIAARDERLARLTREREPECLGQVRWALCVQEWYTRDSYDAKRRANELRKAGFTVEAKHFGEMPVVNGNGERKMIHVTILTAWSDDGELNVPTPKSVGGLITADEARLNNKERSAA